MAGRGDRGAHRRSAVSARAGVVARVGELVVRPITWMVKGSGIGDFGQDLERHRCLAVASKQRGRFLLGPGEGRTEQADGRLGRSRAGQREC